MNFGTRELPSLYVTMRSLAEAIMQVCWHPCNSTNPLRSCPAALPAASFLDFQGADAVNCAKSFEMMWKFCIADICLLCSWFPL